MKRKILILILTSILLASAALTTGCGSKEMTASNQTPTQQDSNAQNNSAANKPAASVTQANTTANQSTVQPSQISAKKDGLESVTKLLDFKLQDINGKEISTKDMQGKKIILSFLTTKAVPSELQMPGMQEIQKEIKGTDFMMIAVIRGEDANAVKTYMDKAKYSFTVLVDTDSKVSDLYKIQGLPTTFFIDAMGNVAKINVGSMQKLTINTYMDLLVD